MFSGCLNFPRTYRPPPAYRGSWGALCNSENSRRSFRLMLAHDANALPQHQALVWMRRNRDRRRIGLGGTGAISRIGFYPRVALLPAMGLTARGSEPNSNQSIELDSFS